MYSTGATIGDCLLGILIVVSGIAYVIWLVKESCSQMMEGKKAPDIPAEFVCTAEELGQMRAAFPGRGPFYLQIAGVIAILFALAGPAFQAVPPREFFLFGVLAIAIRPLLHWAEKSRLRNFSKKHPKGIVYGFKFSAEGCQFLTDGIQKECEWSEVYLIQQTSAYFLIAHKGQKNTRWLPRHAFASDADAEGFLAYARRAKVHIEKM